jgi:hypothetical protein
VAARLTVLVAAAALALPSGASAVTAAVRGGHVVVDGKPFFPIMQWLQCPGSFKQQAALGIDVFLGKGCSDTSDAAELAAAADAGVYSVLPAGSRGTGPALLGWHFDDEPDMRGTTPAQIAAHRRTVGGKVDFLTLTSGFFSKMPPPTWMRGSRDPYHDYARATDLLGFDIYPLYGWCRPDWIGRVADAQRELVSNYAAGRPTFQWIEAASTSSQWCKGRGITPVELRAEVWMAITNGAKGIGYFTHSWTPNYSQFRVSGDVQREIKRTDAQIKSLTPWLLGAPVPLRVESSGRIDAIARRAGGKIYVFAVNVGFEPVTLTAHFSSSAFKPFTFAFDRLGVLVRRV